MPILASRLRWTWLDLCNRRECLEHNSSSGGRIAKWADSSRLTVARMFPDVGRRLLMHCIREWPFAFAAEDVMDIARTPLNRPEVSFIVGIRGTARLPLLQASLSTLQAQVDARCEIIVVEQSFDREIQSFLPPDVRYFHLPISRPEVPWNRSWALNYGVRKAQGRFVILLDADMLLPNRFAKAIAQILDDDVDAVRPVRFIFYLDRPTSEQVQQCRSLSDIQQVAQVTQNTPNPIAMRRDRYLELGGHDESFYGWGGEDNEFVSRLRSLRVSEGGFLPLVHLWHEVSRGLDGGRSANRLAGRLAIPVEKRIRELSGRTFGELTPSVPWQSASEPSADALDEHENRASGVSLR